MMCLGLLWRRLPKFLLQPDSVLQACFLHVVAVFLAVLFAVVAAFLMNLVMARKVEWSLAFGQSVSSVEDGTNQEGLQCVLCYRLQMNE